MKGFGGPEFNPWWIFEDRRYSPLGFVFYASDHIPEFWMSWGETKAAMLEQLWAIRAGLA